MTRDEAAEQLNGNEYRKEGSPTLFAAMKAAGLVAVYGASDDLMEMKRQALPELQEVLREALEKAGKP